MSDETKRTTIILEGVDQVAVNLIRQWIGAADTSTAIRYALRHVGREIHSDPAYPFLCKNSDHPERNMP